VGISALVFSVTLTNEQGSRLLPIPVEAGDVLGACMVTDDVGANLNIIGTSDDDGDALLVGSADDCVSGMPDTADSVQLRIESRSILQLFAEIGS